MSELSYCKVLSPDAVFKKRIDILRDSMLKELIKFAPSGGSFSCKIEAYPALQQLLKEFQDAGWQITIIQVDQVQGSVSFSIDPVEFKDFKINLVSAEELVELAKNQINVIPQPEPSKA